MYLNLLCYLPQGLFFQSLSSLDKTRLETFIFLFEDIISSSSEEDTEVDFFNFFPEFIGLGVGDDLGRLGVLFKDTITGGLLDLERELIGDDPLVVFAML